MCLSYKLWTSLNSFILLTTTNTIQKMKRQPTAWKKIFANHKSDKGLISKTYEGHIQLNSNKINNPNKAKWAEDLNRHFSKEDIQMSNKYVDWYSISLLIRKKVKTMWQYLTTVVMAIIRKIIDVKLIRTDIYTWS